MDDFLLSLLFLSLEVIVVILLLSENVASSRFGSQIKAMIVNLLHPEWPRVLGSIIIMMLYHIVVSTHFIVVASANILDPENLKILFEAQRNLIAATLGLILIWIIIEVSEMSACISDEVVKSAEIIALARIHIREAIKIYNDLIKQQNVAEAENSEENSSEESEPQDPDIDELKTMVNALAHELEMERSENSSTVDLMQEMMCEYLSLVEKCNALKLQHSSEDMETSDDSEG